MKWPYFVLAFWDAIRAEYGAYTITPKAQRSAKPVGFGLAHATVVGLVFGAWLVNVLRGPSAFLAIHLAAAFAVVTSLLAAVTATWSFSAGGYETPPSDRRVLHAVPQRERGRTGGRRSELLSRAIASSDK